MRTEKACNLHLRRDLNDWEMESIASFHVTMEDFNNLVEEGNRIERQKDSTGKFLVSSAYEDLNSTETQEDGHGR